jgi:hypothetical protein
MNRPNALEVVDQQLVSHHFGGDGDRYRRVASRHRYVWPAELDLMARLAGLGFEARHADWHRSSFTTDSTGHVSLWRRPVP